MAVTEDLLRILVCPETKQALRAAVPDEIAMINREVRGRKLKNRGGRLITEEISAALVREDNQYAYPVCEDIPIMLIEEGIKLDAE